MKFQFNEISFFFFLVHFEFRIIFWNLKHLFAKSVHRVPGNNGGDNLLYCSVSKARLLSVSRFISLCFPLPLQFSLTVSLSLPVSLSLAVWYTFKIILLVSFDITYQNCSIFLSSLGAESRESFFAPKQRRMEHRFGLTDKFKKSAFLK